VVNVLINSKVYDKISLYLHLFDEEILKNKSINNSSNKHIIELTNDLNFIDSVKNKIFFFQEFENILEAGENIIDKCIICSESFTADNSKSKMKNQTSSEEDNVEMEAFTEIPINENKENTAKCPNCMSLFHLICLAQSNLESQNLLGVCLIPKSTQCLICSNTQNWSEFVKNI
jgi:hypothetical protein